MEWIKRASLPLYLPTGLSWKGPSESEMLWHFLYYHVVKTSLCDARRIRFLLGVHTTATSEFWDVEAGRCRVPGQPGLQRESQASLSFLVRVSHKTERNGQTDREREKEREMDRHLHTEEKERERHRQRTKFQSF